MERYQCVRLLCALGLALVSGVATTTFDNEFDLPSFLRQLSSGLLLRDEPLIVNQDEPLEGDSPREWEYADTFSTGDDAYNPTVPKQTSGVPENGPLLLTKYGSIKGLTVDKAHIFYGIPYADPPVGAYRWKPPRAVTPWTGVYDATFPRASCMQGCGGPIASDRCPTPVSEDCLYLNIFVPLGVNFTSPLSHLPVLVWIHGGDFIAGSASKPLYDGRFISNFTRTIVVSLEYRLGAFGFLVSGKSPEMSATGNYGILDQQAALLWVQRNIAMFGGDPSKVTLFGESAGAQSVSLHLMMKSSAPLFKQAVLQSLPFSIPFKTRHESLKLGKAFTRQANCSVSDIVCLLALSPQGVLAAQMKTSSKVVNPFRFLEVFETWGPFMDGQLIKEQPVTAFLKGHWQKKPIILGTTSEEGVIFVYGVFTNPVSAVESTVYTTAIFKQNALKVLHKYLPLYRKADHRDMLAQIVTDYVFVCPARHVARAAAAVGGPTWLYMFDHVASDRRIWSSLTPCFQHVCHGAEIPFLFHSATVANFTLTRPEGLLSNRMLCYWAAFAHAGDPSSARQQTPFCREQRPPAWPRYTKAAGHLVMDLTLRPHPQAGSRDAMCDFWDRLGIY